MRQNDPGYRNPDNHTETDTEDRKKQEAGDGIQTDWSGKRAEEIGGNSVQKDSRRRRSFLSRVHIRKIDLNPQQPGEETEELGSRRNTELVAVTYFFIALLLLLTVWIGYLEIFRRDDLNSNINNTKKAGTSGNVIRGSILTGDGTVLASTSIDGDGNETRSYPYSNIFAHVIGYASNGSAGLEAEENYDLMSSHTSLLSQIQSKDDGKKVQGDNVIVTLNPSLQQTAYYALGSYKGAVVVMEPDSGKILAMVSKPDFDPNTISTQWESLVADSSSGVLLNRATQGLYPPGSTFKMLTTLAYLREHPSDYNQFSWDCTGSLSRGDVTITCYHGEQHGQEDLTAAFRNSCNTAFADIGLNLKDNALRNVAEDFLFNSKLPTDIQSSQSVFKLTKNSSDGEKMTTAIGQGDTLVTPLHMAMVTSTIANGGIMMRPYLVDQIKSSEGDTVSKNDPSIYKKLMTPDEAQTITQFMEATVTSGTAQALSGAGYSVAGKTGSAEHDIDGGGTGTHSWFCGFSNVDDPDIAVAVIAEDAGTGSAVAVPIAKQIFDAYYGG